MDNKMFPLRLNKLMVERRLDERMLSEILNESVRMVRGWLDGSCLPNSNTLVRLCEILDTTPNYMLGFGEIDCSVYKDLAKENVSFKEFVSILNKPYIYDNNTCEHCSEQRDFKCYVYLVSGELVKRGYCKGSELVKAIFDEIERNSHINILGYAHISGAKLSDIRRKFEVN